MCLSVKMKRKDARKAAAASKFNNLRSDGKLHHVRRMLDFGDPDPPLDESQPMEVDEDEEVGGGGGGAGGAPANIEGSA